MPIHQIALAASRVRRVIVVDVRAEHEKRSAENHSEKEAHGISQVC
jgi:hypothetical protein